MEQQLDKYGLPLLESIPIGSKNYVLVKTRLQYFRKHYENATIDTNHIFFDGESIMCKTEIHIDGKLAATGMAHEEKRKSNINATSFVEVCETSSVGRALGMLGIGITESVATFDEVNNAQKQQAEMEKVESLLNYKAEQLGIQLFNAINEEDEDSIKAIVSEMRGDQELHNKVKAGLSVEHAEYMDERKTRMAEERKAKSAEKAARNKQAAKEYAESKSA